MRPSDFFRRNLVLSFQEDTIGIRLPPPFPPPLAGEGQGGGVDNMMWGSDYPHSESTFPQSRKILAEILAGVPVARGGVGLAEVTIIPAEMPDSSIHGMRIGYVYADR
jgi:hypothetical protein